MDIPHPESEQDQRYREVRRVTLIGSVLDLALGIIKLVVGFIGHSQALIADGIHSLSDLLTDFMVIYAARHTRRGADESHPYGHERFETIATVALGTALIAVAAGIAWDAGQRLFHPDRLLQPGPLALTVAIASVLSKEWIYHYTMRVAKRLRSKMLQANAWHSRTDAISSIIVVIGLAGTMAGLPYLDAIAAIGVAGIIAWIGGKLAWDSLHELADAALDLERVNAIRHTIHAISGVTDLHLLRTRRMGGNALVDVHIQVDPRISVSEGHHIGETVHRTLVKDIDEVADVMVHIDPEDDEKAAPCGDLPLRDEILAQLTNCWQDIPEAEQIQHITLHYINGKIHLEVLLPLTVLDGTADAPPLADRFAQAAKEVPELGEITLYYR